MEAGLTEPLEIYHKYPHQLSGGMRQRAMIAMAMITRPKLVIADEPTSSLDVTTQNKILQLLKKMNDKHGTSIILISHDLRVIQSICSRAIVMKDGKIVELGMAKELFAHPKTEYTKQLLASVPVPFSEANGGLEETLHMDLKGNDNINTEDGDSPADHTEIKRNTHYSESQCILFRRRYCFTWKKSRKQVIKDATVSVKQEKLLVLSERAEVESPHWQRQLWD